VLAVADDVALPYTGRVLRDEAEKLA